MYRGFAGAALFIMQVALFACRCKKCFFLDFIFLNFIFYVLPLCVLRALFVSKSPLARVRSTGVTKMRFSFIIILFLKKKS